MSPFPGDDARPPFLGGHTGVVCAVLLAAAALMMLWAWTGHPAFAAATCCAVAAVFGAGFVQGGAGWTELVGGPLDGARIRPSRDAHLREAGLVLAAPGGDRVRYRPDGSGRLVYQGLAGRDDR